MFNRLLLISALLCMPPWAYLQCSDALPAAQAFTPAATQTETIPKQGLLKYLPSYKPTDLIIRHQYYILKFNPERNTADWTVYKVTRTQLGNRTAKRKDMKFLPDPLLKNISPTTHDYSRSGYDRGHLVPARDMSFSVDAMAESFYMSNITPQNHEFNAGIWEQLEELVRTLVRQNKELIVITGTIYQKPRDETLKIGNTVKIDVPDAFYKIVYCDYGENKWEVAFIIKNRPFPDKQPMDFKTTIKEIELMTGLCFVSITCF